MVESVALRSIDRIAARCRGSAHVYWPSSRARKQGLSSLCLSPYIYIYIYRPSARVGTILVSAPFLSQSALKAWQAATVRTTTANSLM